MTNAITDLGYVGITQLIVTLLVVFYLLEIIEYFLRFMRNIWVQYAFTIDILLVSLIGSYFYFVMHYYFGYIITVMTVTSSFLYFYGNYMRNLWTHNVLIVNSIIFFIVLFLFLENIKTYIRYIHILFMILSSFVMKVFSK